MEFRDPVNPLTDIIDAASIKFKDGIVQIIKYRQGALPQQVFESPYHNVPPR